MLEILTIYQFMEEILNLGHNLILLSSLYLSLLIKINSFPTLNRY
jgi:hypothetical protein